MYYATYIEFSSSGGSVFQYLYIPNINIGGKSLNPWMATRSVSEQTPHRAWVHMGSGNVAPVTTSDLDVVDNSLSFATPQLKYQLGNPDVFLVGSFVVPLTDEMIMLMPADMVLAVPPRLAQLVSTVRRDLNWPELPGRGL